MKIKPVEHYSNPKLPTKQMLESHPELLKLIPKRWQRNPVVLTALAGLAVMISGCGEIGDRALFCNHHDSHINDHFAAYVLV